MDGCESEKVPRMPKNAIKSSKIVFKERAAPSSVRKRHAASSLTRLSIVGKKVIKCSAPSVKKSNILYSIFEKYAFFTKVYDSVRKNGNIEYGNMENMDCIEKYGLHRKRSS